jgi:2-isopropylmalate synthase
MSTGDGHRPGAHVDLPALPPSVDIYDTTLRDGSQQEGLSLTVDDKLRVAAQLDHLGVAYIEGGWPGANPKDDEFFARAPAELNLATATLVAFGSTRRPRAKADSDDTLRHLVKANTSAVCIVAKAWDRQVLEALRTDLDEAVAMARDSVEFLRHAGLRVFFDAEHFFDGYRSNPEFSLRVLEAAEAAGAETLVLCDTNGGTLPDEVERVLAEVGPRTSASLGVHFHNDGGCAVANTLAGVRRGATQVQGCINGYGERTGNADLCAAIPNLSLKMGVRTIEEERLERLTPVAHHIAELVNIAPNPHQPYVGQSAFAHKAGLHTSAIARGRDLYEHVRPDLVGNGTRFVVSELAGRSTVALKAQELGLDLESGSLAGIVERLKDLEHRGYHFEVADGSLELLMRQASGWKQSFFRLESFRVITEQREDGSFTAAVTRVLIDSTDGEQTWTTIGVSDNIIEASWQALSDSIVYGLLHQGGPEEDGH